MSFTPSPDTQRYASFIAAMSLAVVSASSDLPERLDESHPLPAWHCLKSLDDLDEEESDIEDDNEDELDEEDEDEDEDGDEDLDEDFDDDEDGDEDEEDEDEEDDGVKPLKMNPV